MKKFLLPILVLSLALLGCPKLSLRKHFLKPSPVVSSVAKDVAEQHSATHYMRVVDLFDELNPTAHCSATAVGPHALLTAGHCVTDVNIIYLDSNLVPTTILFEVPDGRDHIIYIVDATFTKYIPIVQRKIEVGEQVHIWGNPGNSKDVYREGHVEGYESGYFEGVDAVRYLLPVFPGDSGSGILDKDGNLIGVVSMGNVSSEGIGFYFNFSAAQLKVADAN